MGDVVSDLGETLTTADEKNVTGADVKDGSL